MRSLAHHGPLCLAKQHKLLFPVSPKTLVSTFLFSTREQRLNFSNINFPMSTKKMQVKFHLRQNADYSLGDRTSYNCERLLQRGSGGRLIYKILVKGEFNTIKHSLYSVFCSPGVSEVLRKGFSAFLGNTRCKDWNHEISS